MERKVFNVFKKDNVSKLQIGNTLISLDGQERRRILKLFTEISSSEELFPAGLKGVCLMYPDGLIAANISIAKVNITGSQYLLFLYHKGPQSVEFECNTFLLTKENIDHYISDLTE